MGQFETNLLRKMDATLVHRGPDGAGVWHDAQEGVGLMHRRLAIIDPTPNGNQPMWDSTRQLVVSFNGEIYNYRELRRELRADGLKFSTECDTEVLVNLYLRDGVDGLLRLNGIFAFALWDTRTKELLLARDVAGVKPLYLATTPAGTVFASELKAVFCAAEVDRSLDVGAVQSYLSFLYAPAPQTMVKGVRKLRPGHAIKLNRDGILSEWCFQRPVYDQPISDMSEEEAIAQTTFYLRQAVERQMVADVPVGSFLSGGLDSSAVVKFGRELAADGSLDCFTIGFRTNDLRREGLIDDLPYAIRVAAHLGVKLHTVWVGSEMSGMLEKMIWHLDEPQADPAALNVFFIAKLARERGVKVLLSGAGGDDIFTGYRRHYALRNERWWSWLPRPARSLLRKLSDAPSKSGPLGRRLAKAFQHAEQAEERRLAGYFVWLRRERVLSLLAPDVRREAERVDPLEPLLDALDRLPPQTAPLNRMLHLDSQFFLTDHNLNYTDKMSMAAGVEVRVPFLDPDLMRFAARLPLRYKQRGATGKWVLKRAMERHLPADVIHRPKAGFGVPLRDWMRGDLRDQVQEALSPSTIKRRGLFDVKEVTNLIELDRAGRIDAAYPIFELMCIETWCRLFLDGKTSGS